MSIRTSTEPTSSKHRPLPTAKGTKTSTSISTTTPPSSRASSGPSKPPLPSETTVRTEEEAVIVVRSERAPNAEHEHHNPEEEPESEEDREEEEETGLVRERRGDKNKRKKNGVEFDTFEWEDLSERDKDRSREEAVKRSQWKFNNKGTDTTSRRLHRGENEVSSNRRRHSAATFGVGAAVGGGDSDSPLQKTKWNGDGLVKGNNNTSVFRKTSLPEEVLIPSSSSNRSLSLPMSPPKPIMGEEKRSATVSVSDSTSKQQQQQAMSAVSNAKRGVMAPPHRPRAAVLDSDGTLGSESDSSVEEIHYGPGFVSRLKSRYMSVALRAGSGTNGGLRRTASLENFLEKDKDDDQVELRQSTKTSTSGHSNKRHSTGSSHNEGSGSLYAKSTSHTRGRPPRATARAATRNTGAAREYMKRAQSIEVLQVNGHEASSERRRMSNGSSDQSPPPLPPKSSSNIDQVVNSLANDNVVIVEKSSPAEKKPSRKSSTSGTADLQPRRPAYKRRSSSLLFSVEEKELPAPDTVKETRKIFESRSVAGGRMPGPFNLMMMTKSKSASNLYHSRSQSVDRAAILARKKSAEEPYSHHHPHPPVPAARRTSSPGPISSPTRTVIKPSLPSKPPHLTPTTTTNAPPPTTTTRKSSTTATQNAQPRPPSSTSATSTFAIPPLRHVEKKDRNNKENKSAPSSGLEEGVKRVSRDSINNIRKGGSSISFNFREHNGSSSGVDSGGSTRQVGVIKPITRTEMRAEERKMNLRNEEKSSSRPEEERKEVIIIDKKELEQPVVNSWKSIAENKRNKAAASSNNNWRHEKKPPPSDLVVSAKPAVIRDETEEKIEKAIKKSRVSSGQTGAGSRSDSASTAKTTTATKKSSPVVTTAANGKESNNNNVAAPGNNKDSAYRENWKKRNDQQNTMVFNFANSKKEVSHIENDGRDISKRSSAKSIRTAATSGGDRVSEREKRASIRA